MRKTAVIISFFILAGCGGGTKPTNDTAGEGQAQEMNIKMPDIPTIISTNEQRGEYLAMHFWDNYDFADTTYINQDVTEQYFVDYLDLLNKLPLPLGVRSVSDMAAKAQRSPQVYSYFNELYEKYLYEPNSPMRNEELYIPVLEKLLASDKVEELEKIRPRSQLDMAMKNRPGTKATDINITLASGKTVRLYDVKSEYVLLYVNNPDCSACREITEAIKYSPVVMPLVKQGVMKIVMVYPDEDIEAWRKNRDEVPADWINGYDKKLVMRAKDLYDLKAIPTLYLLDKNKRVLIKDAASLYPIENYLEASGL